MKTETGRAFITIDQLAQRWGKSPGTVRRWIDEGLPGTRTPFAHTRIGGTIAFSPSQVAAAEADMERAIVPPRPGRRRTTVAK